MTWQNIELGEVLSVKHGWAFKSQYFESEGPFVVVTPGNFFEKGGFRHRPGKDRSYSGEFSNDYMLEEDDLVIAMTEQGPGLLGSSALIPSDQRFLHNQRIGRVLIKDEEKIDRHYLYHLFNTRNVRGQIYGSATGTKVRHTAPERIYRVKADIPDLISQRKIASIISSYDDLIENNQRRIELLEKSARLLYREWFVHFRFPGHETAMFLDGMPEGWEEKTIKDLGVIVTGKTPSKKNASNFNGDIPFIKTPDMHGNAFILQTEETLTEEGARTQPKKTLPPRSILVSCIGTVGAVSINSKEAQFNQQINAVIPSGEINYIFTYFLMKGIKQKLEGFGSGATMANVNKTKFESISVLIPDKETMDEYYNQTCASFEQISSLSQLNMKLEKARDLLLPRLMDGRIEV